MALKFDPDYLLLAVTDKQWEKTSDFKLIRRDIGKIKIITGKLVACDPFFLRHREIAFTQTLPVGEHLVRITIVRFANSGDERIAFANIRLSDNKPVRWEMMIFPGQDVSKLSNKEFVGYGVDSRAGCFVDEKVTQYLQKNKDNRRAILDKLGDELDGRYQSTRTWGNLDIDDGNIIAFFSGWGDGSYPTFAGFDENNQLAAVVTDFMVFYHEYHNPPEDSEN